MTDLIVWLEKGLSEVDEADQRYQRILASAEPVPFSSLEAKLKDFIKEIAGQYPDAIVTLTGDASPVEAGYSKLGVLLRFGDDAPQGAYEEVAGAATELELTMYDPEMGLVMGYDDSLDVEVLDNE
jgi:hypothetical protein